MASLPSAVQLDACTLCTSQADPRQQCPHKRLAQPPPEGLLHNGLFYRVYDDLSQSRYSRENGFLCRDENIYWLRPELRFPRDLVKKHLDWTNREPTSYISISGSLEKALGECERRLASPVLGRFVSRGQVRVSVVEGLEKLRREGVFLTSLVELRRTGVLGHYDDYAYGDEWLVLDHIPASCVLADGTAEQFIGNYRRA